MVRSRLLLVSAVIIFSCMSVAFKIEVMQRYVPAVPGPIQDSGPGVYDLYCQSEDVDLGALGPGKYSLVWTYGTNNGPVSVATTVNNGASARGRAVRGH